ncbi:MAG: UDP-N-acetyl glucosamine 2-epimerase, partial [Calditrichaeota bacterium]
EESGNQNLEKEGVSREKIHFVGNVMIDSLVNFLEKARQSNILQELGLDSGAYALVTLHRPSNVDVPDNFLKILTAFETIQQDIPIVFPIHPRTQKNLERFGLTERVKAQPNLRLLPPVGYLDFLQLMQNCKFVLTDSGGIQEETTYLGIPCLTLRENTERPVTATLGTNEVVGLDVERIIACSRRILAGEWKSGQVPPLWDGQAAKRIVDILARN